MHATACRRHHGRSRARHRECARRTAGRGSSRSRGCRRAATPHQRANSAMPVGCRSPSRKNSTVTPALCDRLIAWRRFRKRRPVRSNSDAPHDDVTPDRHAAQSVGGPQRSRPLAGPEHGDTQVRARALVTNASMAAPTTRVAPTGSPLATAMPSRTQYPHRGTPVRREDVVASPDAAQRARAGCPRSRQPDGGRAGTALRQPQVRISWEAHHG